MNHKPCEDRVIRAPMNGVTGCRLPFRVLPPLLLFAVLLLPASSFSQEYFIKERKDWKVEPVIMLQFWGVYGHGQEVFNVQTGQYDPVGDRINFQIRRGRFGFRTQPYETLKFTVIGNFDLVGRDALVGTIGGYNPPTPNVGLWDAFFTWKISPESESLHLTGGFFRPQFSRESITSGWSTTSMEKSMSQNYIRRHLVGTGPGRATGLNLGGLIRGRGKRAFSYNAGIFTPLHSADPTAKFAGLSAGIDASPLLTARTVLHVGDPEQTRYKIGYDINYYSERKGVSIGLNGAYQGKTDLFARGMAFGADALLNYGPLNLDAEWIWMQRSGTRSNGATSLRSFDYGSRTGHARLGYNLVVGEKFIEPVFMVMFFEGGKAAEEQADAAAVGAFSGSEQTYDLGLNWYLNKKHLKLTLHYTWHQGDPGQAGPGATVNAYFSQSSIGAIHRGDWLGLGMNVIL